VLDAYQDRFTSNRLVKINPGYTFTQPLEYSLTKTMDLGDVDFAVKERLFTFFLPLGCVPTTDDHALHERIVLTFNPGGVKRHRRLWLRQQRPGLRWRHVRSISVVRAPLTIPAGGSRLP
jgi:hypothetical protein